MNFYVFRRLSVLVFTFFFIGALPLIANAHQIPTTASIQTKLAELEASVGGRLGVSAINTANNARIQYRAEERFPFASTGKVMIVAAILKESERNPALLEKKITFSQRDVGQSGYAPITQQHITDGMQVNELCQAAIEYSDNAATNFLVKILGGPAAVTTYARSIHDPSFRLDWWEPNLTAPPGAPQDTTTPKAMENSLQQLILGDALALSQREQLRTWLKNNTTGNNKIRAGVPKTWIVADKTGNGSYGTTNDIAVIWPPKCSPIVLVVYLTQREEDAVKHDEAIASVTRLVLDEFAKTDQCIKYN